MMEGEEWQVINWVVEKGHSTCLAKKKYNKTIHSVSHDVMQLFTAYSWPGNVRELEHAMEHGFVLCTSDVIGVDHIPPEILKFNTRRASVSEAVKTESEEKQELISILEKTDWNKAKAARLMGVSRPTLYRKLEKYDLEQDPGS